jgi:hypothetical protein
MRIQGALRCGKLRTRTRGVAKEFKFKCSYYPNIPTAFRNEIKDCEPVYRNLDVQPLAPTVQLIPGSVGIFAHNSISGPLGDVTAKPGKKTSHVSPPGQSRFATTAP